MLTIWICDNRDGLIVKNHRLANACAQRTLPADKPLLVTGIVTPFNGNTVLTVAEQRELPGECLQNAGSPDGLRRFRYLTGRSFNGERQVEIYQQPSICVRGDILFYRVKLASDSGSACVAPSVAPPERIRDAHL